MSLSSLRGRSLLSWMEYTPGEIRDLLTLAVRLKGESLRGLHRTRMRGKTLALVFGKRSTRTRAAFETAFGEEGGHPVFLPAQEILLGAGESIEDTARVLGGMFDAIGFRGFDHSEVEGLATYAGVPVYNLLTDRFHPVQALADVLTIEEEFGSCRCRKLCYVGDGRNNVARSLAVVGAKLGMHVTFVSPRKLWTEATFRDLCAPAARESGARIEYTDAVGEGVRGADVLYTDTWVSMGEEALRDERAAMLDSFRIDSATLASTGNPRCIFMHCLPANTGEEASREVVEGPASRVFRQAANHKHAAKAILLATLSGR